MDIKEATAAGWYFGVSNLGMGPVPPSDLIEKFESDWDKIAQRYRFDLESYMESDEMYEGALEEVHHWIGIMVGGKDEYFIKEWEKRKEIKKE